jgi:hypothetical protein
MMGWYSQLVGILSFLETMPGEYLNDDHLQRLGIHLSNLDLETDKASDSDPQFFRSFPREHLKISSCAVDPPEHNSLPDPADRKRYDGDFDLGRVLDQVIGCHLIDIHMKYPIKWERIKYRVTISSSEHELC